MSQLETAVREQMLRTDINLLQKFDCSDNTMQMMLAEHGARIETLSKALLDPGMGKALLMCLASKFLDCANQINERTVVE